MLCQISREDTDMSNRTHMARYPWYAYAKRSHGPMPKWLKRFHHSLERRMEREALAIGEEPEDLKKGRIQCMWY